MNMRYIVIRKCDQARLCKDGNFRTLAFFGTYPECVKIYKRRGWIERRIKKSAGDCEIASITDGQAMDARGFISEYHL